MNKNWKHDKYGIYARHECLDEGKKLFFVVKISQKSMVVQSGFYHFTQ